MNDQNARAARAPRSYLYVPGHVARKLERARDFGADALIIDLEDAVPFNQKQEAMAATSAWLDAGTSDGEVWVRVNESGRGIADVRALAGHEEITGFVLPKVDTAADVLAVSALLDELGASQMLMPMIESASAVHNALEIAGATRVRLLQMGEIDLAADLGMTPGSDESELASIRTQVVLVSRLAGLVPPPAPVSSGYRDLEAFAVSTARLARLGFLGRVCIHPSQIPVAHGVFSVTDQQVEEAEALIAKAEQAAASGLGAVDDGRGNMIDPAVLRAAFRILSLRR